MTCTHCGAATAADAKFCHACGYSLTASTRLCGKCGAINPADAKVCVHCKGDLAAIAARKAADNRPRTSSEQKRDKVIAFGCWFIALFLVLQAMRYISVDLGKTLFVVAAAFGLGGFSIWPKTPPVPPPPGDVS
jgi:ribosomal protein L40E